MATSHTFVLLANMASAALLLLLVVSASALIPTLFNEREKMTLPSVGMWNNRNSNADYFDYYTDASPFAAPVQLEKEEVASKEASKTIKTTGQRLFNARLRFG